MLETLEKMMESFNHPDIQGCLAAVEKFAAYHLPVADRQPFLLFHKYVSDPQPQFISNWRSQPDTEKWYNRFTNGMLGDVQNSLACVLYHSGRLLEIERNTTSELEKFHYRETLSNSVVSPGNSLKMDFEYQAFVLAVRRTLEYLTRVVSAYFKDEAHSFSKLENTLNRFKDPTLSDPIKLVFSKYLRNCEYIVTNKDSIKMSTRDRIAHREFVSVGCINLSKYGFVIAGGGENLQPFVGERLTEVVRKHVTNLQEFLGDFIRQFLTAIAIHQLRRATARVEPIK